MTKITSIVYYSLLAAAGLIAGLSPLAITYLNDQKRADAICYDQATDIMTDEPKLKLFVFKRVQDGLLTRGECKEIDKAKDDLARENNIRLENDRLRQTYEIRNEE